MNQSDIVVGGEYEGGKQGHNRFVFRVDKGLGKSIRENITKVELDHYLITGGSWVGFDTIKNEALIGMNRYVSLKSFANWAIRRVDSA
jgi:hypothetical protein